MSLSEDLKILLKHSSVSTPTASTKKTVKIPRDVIEGIINFALADGLYDSEYLEHEFTVIRIVSLPDPVILEYEDKNQ